MEPTTRIVLFCLVVLVTEVVGTVSGFGSSVFLVPAAATLFDFHTALALTGMAFVFGSCAKLIWFRGHIRWQLMWMMGVPSVLFTLLGAYSNRGARVQIAELAMGGFLIAFAIAASIRRGPRLAANNRNAAGAGVVSGFLNGFIGTGGAIRGAALTAFGLPKSAFVATSAGIDLGGDIGRTAVYIAGGYMEAKYFGLIPVLAVLTYAGTAIGKAILDRVPEKAFKVIVASLIIVTGVLMVYDAAFGKQIVK